MSSAQAQALLQDVLGGRAKLLCDGGMGSAIQSAGLWNVHKVPDILNVTHPDDIMRIHASYVDAGSRLITTNTFNTHAAKLDGEAYTVEEIYAAAAHLARKAGATIVAGDMGPTGMILEPFGDASEEEVYASFARNAQAIESAGCDVILIETMTDLEEAKIAVTAALDRTSLPVLASLSFSQGGRTIFGVSIADAVRELADLGVSAVGANCSLGPRELAAVIREARTMTDIPLIAQPNAGLPNVIDGSAVYDMTADEFADAMSDIIAAGATIIGGCCGTDPAFIRALSRQM